ncbi:DUF2231 domain-containing protein [Phycicoccus flavus]|uniref:DUF2231 domain-containing protein n=1 Tax=Phycicoccus flavus TaxID=2502783 RepID=UPI000FEBEE18|nr:DUF2231 domain-containing protein [Phycicoccus flavus]NHA69244.1 hypothetical protein [Phycicoccus flavus]
MFDNFLGLPLHPLVIHAVVVLTPLFALMLLLFSVSERFRVWSGWLTPAVGALATVFAFVASSSGESLEKRVKESAALREHTELGGILPWVVLGVTVLAAALWWFWRSSRTGTEGGRSSGTSTLVRVLGVVGVVAALGLTVDVALVGHYGAEAVWQGTPAQSRGGGEG